MVILKTFILKFFVNLTLRSLTFLLKIFFGAVVANTEDPGKWYLRIRADPDPQRWSNVDFIFRRKVATVFLHLQRVHICT